MSVTKLKCLTCTSVSTQAVNVLFYGAPRCPCCGGTCLVLARGQEVPEGPPLPPVIDAARALHAFLKPGTQNRSATPTPNELTYFTLMGRLGEALEKLDARTSNPEKP